MYFIHPNHVNVRLPKDCTDDEVVLGEDNDPIIGPQPTGMTVFLERVRLAHLCREMADIVPLEINKLTQLPYDHIIALDRRLEEFISSMPFFFKFDAESRQKSKALETIYPTIPVWRYCITTAAHSRRCKLHQKFLLRQSWDPRYVYSRQACLESARTVVHVYEDIASFYSPSTLVVRMGKAVHFTHLAIAVMVMDLCFNKGEADEAEIKADVKKALQIFEDARDLCPLLDRYLNSFNEILEKHHVYLTDRSGSVQETGPGAFDTANDAQMQSAQFGGDVHDVGLGLDTSFDDFWLNAFQSEPNLDSLTWDSIFSALDSQPV